MSVTRHFDWKELRWASRTLQILEHNEILCGLAIGYAIDDFPANNLDVRRKSIDETTVFLCHYDWKCRKPA